MLHFIYKTTNLLNGKYYYGVHSSKTLDDKYLGSGSVINTAIRKHGRSNFKREIVAMFDDRKSALLYERELVTPELIKDHNCYNAHVGGNSPPQHFGVAFETVKLKGDKRTKAQKLAAKRHSKMMKGKPAVNRKTVTVFGKEFKSTKDARSHFNLSISQYYYLQDHPNFKNPKKLKEHIWSERNKKISKARNGR